MEWSKKIYTGKSIMQLVLQSHIKIFKEKKKKEEHKKNIK